LYTYNLQQQETHTKNLMLKHKTWTYSRKTCKSTYKT